MVLTSSCLGIKIGWSPQLQLHLGGRTFFYSHRQHHHTPLENLTHLLPKRSDRQKTTVEALTQPTTFPAISPMHVTVT